MVCRLFQRALPAVLFTAFLAGCQTGSSFWPLGSSEEPESQRLAKKELEKPSKVYLAYGKWQEQAGNAVEARQSYEFVLDEDPKSAEAILGLARLDRLAGRKQAAEEGFLKAVRMQPEDPATLHALGRFYAAEQRWNDAVEPLHRAMLAAPTHSKYRFDLAVALVRTGRVEEARPHFVQSVGDAEANYNIGYILYEQGKFDQAEQEFVQALVKRPDLDQAQAMLTELRQERESKRILAGSQPQRRYQPLPPPPGEVAGRQRRERLFRAPDPNVVPAGTRTGRRSRGSGVQHAYGSPGQPASMQGKNGLTPAQIEQRRNQSEF